MDIRAMMIRTARDAADNAYETLNDNFSVALINLLNEVKEQYPASVEALSSGLECAGLESNTINELVMSKLAPDEYWELYSDYHNIFETIQKLDEWANDMEERNG